MDHKAFKTELERISKKIDDPGFLWGQLRILYDPNPIWNFLKTADGKDKIDRYKSLLNKFLINENHWIEIDESIFAQIQRLNNDILTRSFLVNILRVIERYLCFFYLDYLLEKKFYDGSPSQLERDTYLSQKKIFNESSELFNRLDSLWNNVITYMDHTTVMAHSIFDIKVYPGEVITDLKQHIEHSYKVKPPQVLDVKSLALDTYIKIQLGILESFPMPYATGDRKRTIENYGDSLGVSKYTFYRAYIDIEASGGVKGYAQNQIDKLELVYEGNDGMFNKLMSITKHMRE